MRHFVLTQTPHGPELVLRERDLPVPRNNQVLVRIKACSINFRDQVIAKGAYFDGLTRDLTPLSDGAGEVVAVGPAVARIRNGDRVLVAFFENWDDGPYTRAVALSVQQPSADGVLSEYVLLPEQRVITFPEFFSFEEAATFACAGTTAWNALMEGRAPIGKGSSLLILGTGGVSLFALQIASAVGARTIVISSSDEKIARAQAMGASSGINYRKLPDWGRPAAELAESSDPQGFSHILEVGGSATLTQSLEAIGYGGEIATIGALTPYADGPDCTLTLKLKSASLRGIMVGSRRMTQKLIDLMHVHELRPVIDRVLPFEQAAEAYKYQASSGIFGKVVISIP